MIRAIPDADGWVQTVIVQEVKSPSTLTIPEGERLLTDEPTIPLPVAYLDQDGLKTPHDDRIAWRRFRKAGYDGAEAAALARSRELGGLPDAGVTVAAPAGHAGINAEYPDVPGLILRTMSGDDLDVAAPRAIDAGIQPERCPGEEPCCRPTSAHGWLNLAARLDRDDTWQTVLEHDGQPLQMELILIRDGQAVFTFTTHLNRERPHWFWREAQRPVFERLKAAGVTRVVSATRADRPDWIQALQEHYGAEPEGAWDEKTVRLRFDLDEALRRSTGWPARRTAGANWSWAQGPITVREVSEDELPTIQQQITDLWPDAQGSERPRQMMRQWWVLDRATLLLALRDGQPFAIRAVRHRRDQTSGMAMLTPMLFPADQAILHRGFVEWHRAVGYRTSTTFVPERMWDNPRIQEHVIHGGWHVVARRTEFREPFIEIETEIEG